MFRLFFLTSLLHIHKLLRVAGGAMIILSGLAALYVIPNFVAVDALPSNRSYEQKSLWGIYAQLAILVCSVLIVYDTTIKLQLRAGLPIINQTLSWIILGKGWGCMFYLHYDAYLKK